MAINKRDEGKKVNSNINVTPMVDVMLMSAHHFHGDHPDAGRTRSTSSWPRSTIRPPMPDADKEDAVVVAVTRDGRIFLGQNQVSEADLAAKVRDSLKDKTSKQIYIRADARAKYGTVTDAIDDVRTAGVDEVGLLTEQRQTLTKPPAAAGGQ